MFLIPASSYRIKTTAKKGRAVFATREIAPDTVIGDYTGTIVHPEDEDEKNTGLYTIEGGKKYDIIASPKEKGLHCINHSCAPNAAIYPYRGHMLFIALRKIFSGEELTIGYMLGKADKDETITCEEHACYCGSRFCTGSMHDKEETFATWEKFLKKQFGPAYNTLPGAYGTKLPPLEKYPATITEDHPDLYNLFGSEKKPALKYNDKILPAVAELRRRIHETGQRPSFPMFDITINGVKNGILLVDRQN